MVHSLSDRDNMKSRPYEIQALPGRKVHISVVETKFSKRGQSGPVGPHTSEIIMATKPVIQGRRLNQPGPVILWCISLSPHGGPLVPVLPPFYK